MKKVGNQSVKFQNNVYIKSAASVVGKKEGEGPLKNYFDIIIEDYLYEEKSFEKAESKMSNTSLNLAIEKAKLKIDDVDYVISGDLLNQNIASTFSIRNMNIPFLGLFGACSTIGEAFIVASMIIDGDFGKNILIGASSHFCTAERQFRFPLDLGVQRSLTSHWTVTGCGSFLLSNEPKEGPFINKATIGKIIDMGIKDVNNMGAAMAPAACDTICNHFKDFNITPDYYDIIITGDLGYIGRNLLIELTKKEGYDISKNYEDCGILIFDQKMQNTNAGGSGCACSAVTFAGYLYNKLKKYEYSKMLFIPTGALLSTTSSQQGESIPSIAYALSIEIGR